MQSDPKFAKQVKSSASKKSFESTERKDEVKSKLKSKGKTVHSFSKSELEDFYQLKKSLVLVEYKEPPRLVKSGDPSLLRHSAMEFLPTLSQESRILSTMLTRMFANKHYAFRLSTALNMSSSGAGAVNSVIQVSTISSNTEFIALGAVFNECFIRRVDVQWEPVSLYNGPLGFAQSTQVSSLPLGCANLQHAVAAYSNLADMTENYRYYHTNTGRRFKYSWVNIEDEASTTVVGDVTSGTPVQSWARTSNISSYTGTLQFLTQSAPPGLPVSQVLGTFLAEWEIVFRNRQ